MDYASQPGSRRRRGLLGLFVGSFLLLFLLFSAVAGLYAAAGGSGLKSAAATDRIAVISISGLISAGGEQTLFGSSGGAIGYVDNIRDAAADQAVKAILIRLNSPGGTPSASQEIYDAILAARERKPVIASMADVAASGAYYVAAACDRIVANRSTATGSIGVIMAGYDMSGLLEWIRIKPETITSGRYKDLGSPDRPMTDAERKLLQSLVNQVYQQFVDDIVRGRQMKRADVLRWADGRILTGQQAHAAGLVDDLGGFYQAVKVAQEAAGLPVTDQPNLWFYGAGSFLEQLLGARAPNTGRPTGASGGLVDQLRRLSPVWLLADPAALPLTVQP